MQQLFSTQIQAPGNPTQMESLFKSMSPHANPTQMESLFKSMSPSNLTYPSLDLSTMQTSSTPTSQKQKE